MVNNEEVGCLHTSVLSMEVVSWMCSTIADPTVLNYSGLDITFNLMGGRPRML